MKITLYPEHIGSGGRTTWAYRIAPNSTSGGIASGGNYVDKESAKIAAEKEADRIALKQAATTTYDYQPTERTITT